MNLNKYLIGIEGVDFKDSDIVVVYANNKEFAIDKYIATVGINNEFFLEGIYNPFDLFSYANNFLYDECGNYLNNQSGYSQKEIDEIFNYNVHKFFRENIEWYNLYMSIFEYEDEKDENGFPIPKHVTFPKEMLIHMYKNDISNLEQLFCKEIGVEIKEID